MNSPDNLVLEDLQNVLKQGIEPFLPLKNSKIVITGGTGFIGTWLAWFLAYLNDVFTFNIQINLVARNIDQFKKTRPTLANRKDLKLISADIRYMVDLPTDTNWIIHAAGTPDNRVHSSYPMETMSVIANGTYSILNASERCSNLKMFLNVSSGLIYGPQSLKQPKITENCVQAPKCGTVSSAYAEAKRYAETLCHSSRSQARTPVVTVRPFAFVGPYQSLETPWAINNFIKDAFAGSQIRILGDGKTVRSYMYASDMAYWILSILAKGSSGEIYNIGSPESITLAKLAAMIKKEFDFSLDIKLKTSSSNDLQNSRFVPDVSFAERNLGLSLTVDLETAIKRTIEWNRMREKIYE